MILWREIGEKDELSTKGNPRLLGKFKFRTALFGAEYSSSHQALIFTRGRLWNDEYNIFYIQYASMPWVQVIFQLSERQFRSAVSREGAAA